jgi:hypothetical protein
MLVGPETNLRAGQALYYRNGLAHGSHSVTLTARGAGNPLSNGAELFAGSRHTLQPVQVERH